MEFQDFQNVHNLVKFYIDEAKLSTNIGAKNLIIQKLLSLIGNLIKENHETMTIYIKNNFLELIVLN